MPQSLRSPKIIKRRRRKFAFRIFFAFVAFLVVIGGPIFLLRSNFLKISSIEIDGNSVISKESLTQIVDKALVGNYFFVLPRSSIILYPHENIVNTIIKNFSRIESVDVKRLSLRSIKVSVTERKPQALWCENADSTNCFFIDSNGLVFDSAPSFSPDVFMIYTGRLDSKPIGSYYLPTEQFNKIQVLLKKIRALGLNLVRLEYDSGNSYKFVTHEGSLVFFSIDDDVDKVSSNLASVLSDPKLNIFQNHKLSVYSVDLRYGNKVIVKKKGSSDLMNVSPQ
jgi:cell division septal protein FtsQ